MTNGYGNAAGPVPTSIYCPQCGQAMRIAPEHVRMTVACPHCQHQLEPWRFTETMPGRATPSPPPTAPPIYADPMQGPGVYSWRNRWVAGALGVLLGGFGVHRFYLGFTGIGFAQIAATVLTLGIVGPIWGFIEGILCFCGAMRDVDGLPLRN